MDVLSVAIFFYTPEGFMKLKTKRITEKRLVAVLLIFTMSAGILLFNIFRLCYLNYDYYRDKTYDQITTSSVLKAERGKIYDSNMNILAKSDTVWRIFVSTRDIKKAEKAEEKAEPKKATAKKKG